MQGHNFDPRRESMPGPERFHIGSSAMVHTFRSVALGFIAVVAGFFVSVLITIYGGFPLWFL